MGLAGSERSRRIEAAWLPGDFVDQSLSRRRGCLTEVRLTLAAGCKRDRAQPKHGSAWKSGFHEGLQRASLQAYLCRRTSGKLSLNPRTQNSSAPGQTWLLLIANPRIDVGVRDIH